MAPSLFPRIRYGRALLSLLGICIAIVATRYVMEYQVLLPLLHFDNYFGHPMDLWHFSRNCILYTYDFSLYGVILYFLVNGDKVRQEKIKAELSFLKSQVNPHFLFNTINDIYALAYQKSDEAPEALLKLSGILRYMLYEASTEKVGLGKEVDYLVDYLDLQRIGSKQNTYIDFTVEGSTDRLQIAPLILIPFAENIVKHGVINDKQHPASLSIRIRDDHFSLRAANTINGKQEDHTGGIGLQNVRRRLELLYPGRHTFQVTRNDGIFMCNLDIHLKS